VTSSKHKVAVIAPKYGSVGGAEKLAQEVTERIALNPRYEVHVFANQWSVQSDRITFHKVPIIVFPRFLKPLSFAWFVKRKMATMDFDLIHSHERVFETDLLSIHGLPHRAWIKRIRKKRMSLFDHVTAWVEHRLIENKRCRAFLAVSNLTRDQYLEEFGVDPTMLQVVHPGVAPERFVENQPGDRLAIRRLCGIGDEDTVILFVGMNFEIKGLDLLMSAVSMVKSLHSSRKIKLLVVGKGNFKKYEALARKLRLQDDIIFTGVLKDCIERVYMMADIFSMLSSFDAFGLTVLEAMAASLPVIISNKVGAKDIVLEGVNGFVVEREDIQTIASKISLLLNPRERNRISRAARETAMRNTWENMTERVTQVYESLLVQ
jgi:UDP-glucose:(heptosyl)LPS alpha-1,3-glucosyltransferase